MFFVELPPEILGQITDLVGGGAAIFLWLSGSSKLLNLLGPQCGITCIRLKDRSPSSTSRWPMFLAQLKGLRELTIDRGDLDLKATKIVTREIKKLSKLQKLHLNCSDSSKIFGEPTSFELYFPALQSLWLHSLGDQGRFHTFPSGLTGLKMGPVIRDEPIALVVPCELPKNLQRLEYPSSVFTYSSAEILAPLAKLPIHTMALGLQFWCDGFVLPSTLTTLELRLPPPMATSLGFLPLSLEHLTLSMERIDLKQIFRLSGLSSLHLLFKSHLQSSQALFPLKLRKLVVDCACSTTRLILPNSLVTFVSQSWSAPFVETFLEGEDLSLLTYDELLNPRYSMVGLPRTLKQLKATFTANLTRKHTIPAERLLPNQEIPTFFGQDKLPSSLEVFGLTLRFHFPRGDPRESCVFYDLLTQIIGLESLNNVTSLKSLAFEPVSIPSSLPPLENISDSFGNLTSLVLAECMLPNQGQNQKFFCNLPPFLRRLNLSFCMDLIPAAWISNFPRTLMDLEIRSTAMDPSQISISPPEFASLSRFTNLSRLVLYYDMPEIEDHMLRCLPKHSMLELRFCGRCPVLSSGCFKYLPRFLESLEMRLLTSCEDDDAIHLPRTIRRLILCNCSFSAAALPYLPTTIQRYNLASSSSGLSLHKYIHREGEQQLYPDERIAINSVNFTTVAPIIPKESAISEETQAYERNLDPVTSFILGLLARIWPKS